MVNNSFYSCIMCGCHLRFRYQCGFFDIPVSVYCPNCHTHIYGTINLESLPNGEHINNAIIQPQFEDGYKIELSTEFVVKKCEKNNNGIYDLTPFLRNNPCDEARTKRRNDLIRFASHAKEYKEIIGNIFNLLKTNNPQLLKQYLKNHSNPFIDYFKESAPLDSIQNQFDVLMATKHYMTAFLRRTMLPSISDKVNQVMKIIDPLFRQKFEATLCFLKYSSKSGYFDIYYSKIPEFIIAYIEVIYQLIPLYDIYQEFDSVDQTINGITTLSVEDMETLYAKGYELLGESVDLLFGLHNIESYGSYDNFGNGRDGFYKKMTSYSSKYLKYQDLSTINNKYTEGLLGVLDNIIRNSIAHNSIEIDGLNQIITFIDKHKEKRKELKLSFLDFGKRCIDLYSSILIIWEYYYQLLKYKLMMIDKCSPNYVIAVKQNNCFQ